MVRLVRACGSKLDIKIDIVGCNLVRLVRACGSKLTTGTFWRRGAGQARKSLWIETPSELQLVPKSMVRLVRACGSKQTNGGLLRQF